MPAELESGVMKKEQLLCPSADRCWWNKSEREVAGALSVDLKTGLSSAEANSRLTQYGPNQLPEKKRITPLKIFLNQFNSLIVWVLIAAVLIALLLREWLDSAAIGVIIILNALLGFIQEYRAEKSLEALRRLSSPTSKVKRDGIPVIIPSGQIVPGDLLLLEAGDKIPADARITSAAQFRSHEASLTGESVPVAKTPAVIELPDLPLGDRRNMAFMGTAAVNGKAEAVVTATGLQTELGKIASLLESPEEEKTPLQVRLEMLGKKLIFFFLAVIGLVFVTGILRGHPWGEMLLTSLSLAVAAIPEGLPAVVTISLALGVRKMATRNALIRRLTSVETLGCASVICSDKTGTLTKNEMTVRTVWAGGEFFEVTGAGYSPEGGFENKEHKKIVPQDLPDVLAVLKIGVLCNGAELRNSSGSWQIIGDPTEAALLTSAAKAGFWKKDLEEAEPVLEELPFDSDRKRMSVLRQSGGGKVLYVKGAPDVLLARSDFILEQGKVFPLDESKRKQITAANLTLAAKALRVLAFAFRDANDINVCDESQESRLVFAGLQAMMDPPREEVKEAIQHCREAGIQPVMITGDHKQTALAIARELGMIRENEIAIDGRELDQMSPEELEKQVHLIAVYARVSAENKLKIVRAWKKRGMVVAMTGDGVNDAPAVKEANIGVAMGITGTDVTKEASDMVITDDNFASIVSAVEEGRGIYDNILKFVNYLLSSNLAEIMVLFTAMMIGWRDEAGRVLIPLSAVQILWMNLITDGLPALALGIDPVSPGAMKRPPRRMKEPIFTRSFSIRLFVMSVLIAAGSLAACFWGLQYGAAFAQTMTLTTLIALQLVRVQMVRGEYRLSLLSNRWLIASLVFSLLLQGLIIYTAAGQKIFGTAALTAEAWGVVVAIAGLVWGLGKMIAGLISSFAESKKNRFQKEDSRV